MQNNMKNLFPVLLLFLFACKETPKPVSNNLQPKNNSVSLSPNKTNIGKTGFTIELPSSHKIEEVKGKDYSLFYISASGSNSDKSGGGIYYGPSPDEHAPPTVISKNISTAIIHGKNARVTQYETQSYQTVETIIDEDNGMKLQYWYYGYNETEMISMNKMMNSISRK
jgi:hypothetical protein